MYVVHVSPYICSCFAKLFYFFFLLFYENSLRQFLLTYVRIHSSIFSMNFNASFLRNVPATLLTITIRYTYYGYIGYVRRLLCNSIIVPLSYFHCTIVSLERCSWPLRPVINYVGNYQLRASHSTAYTSIIVARSNITAILEASVIVVSEIIYSSCA